MSAREDRRSVESPEQRDAMRHPTRHRITLALTEPMTVSELARELGINKGNVAHHMAVLERVGLVQRAGSLTGRGGTRVLFRSTPLRLQGREATSGMMQTVADGLVNDPEAFALLRAVRLTPTQARSLSEHLERLVLDHPEQTGSPRFSVFVSVARA